MFYLEIYGSPINYVHHFTCQFDFFDFFITISSIKIVTDWIYCPEAPGSPRPQATWVSWVTAWKGLLYFISPLLYLKTPLFKILNRDYFLFFWLTVTDEPRRIHTHALYAPKIYQISLSSLAWASMFFYFVILFNFKIEVFFLSQGQISTSNLYISHFVQF